MEEAALWLNDSRKSAPMLSRFWRRHRLIAALLSHAVDDAGKRRKHMSRVSGYCYRVLDSGLPPTGPATLRTPNPMKFLNKILDARRTSDRLCSWWWDTRHQMQWRRRGDRNLCLSLPVLCDGMLRLQVLTLGHLVERAEVIHGPM